MAFAKSRDFFLKTEDYWDHTTGVIPYNGAAFTKMTKGPTDISGSLWKQKIPWLLQKSRDFFRKTEDHWDHAAGLIKQIPEHHRIDSDTPNGHFRFFFDSKNSGFAKRGNCFLKTESYWDRHR